MTRVLAVDDEEALLTIITVVAENLGCVVETLDSPLHFMKTFARALSRM